MTEMHELCVNCSHSFGEHDVAGYCPAANSVFLSRPFIELICIRKSHLNDIKYGERYKGQHHSESSRYVFQNGDWWDENRFIVYDSKWDNFIVQCINDKEAEGDLIVGSFYTVLGENSTESDYWLKEAGLTYMKSRFKLLSKNYNAVNSAVKDSDPEETRLRNILTSVSSDPYTCNKCGAPKSACTWHD